MPAIFQTIYKGERYEVYTYCQNPQAGRFPIIGKVHHLPKNHKRPHGYQFRQDICWSKRL